MVHDSAIPGWIFPVRGSNEVSVSHTCFRTRIAERFDARDGSMKSGSVRATERVPPLEGGSGGGSGSFELSEHADSSRILLTMPKKERVTRRNLSSGRRWSRHSNPISVTQNRRSNQVDPGP